MNGFRSITTQYGVSRFKNFKEERYKVTVSELNDNLMGLNTVKLLDKKEIPKDVGSNALSYLMFLKKKRSGNIKAYRCADGRPQRK